MKRNKVLSLFLILALFVSMVGIINVDTTYAAAKKKASNKVKVKVASYTSDSVTINWNKIKKPDKGYAVFRNGKAIAHLGKKATKFTDTNLAPGTSYTYQIKTFKVKKVKKKGKKVRKYTYKKKSNKISVTTYPANAAKPANQNNASSPSEATDVVSYNKQFIQDYVNKNGYTNGNGDKTVHFSNGSSNDVYIVSHAYSIELISYVKTNDMSMLTTMLLDTSYNAVVSPIVTIGSLEMRTTFIPEKYTKYTKLSFTSDSSSASLDVAQNLANSAFKLAMSSWDLALFTNYNITMKDLGFLLWD